MSSPILQIDQVVKQFENHLALDKVSLVVPKGVIYGLLGPNGAGKTTLIRIINQITMPDSGGLFIDGRPIERDDTMKIGYLPEERGLYKKMRVGEHLLYLARLKGLDKRTAKERAEEWFKRLEIDNWWNLKVEELSKGMQQKIQFISTVIHEPRLLIFDEPFSGFDPVNAKLIKEQMLRLKQNGATILLSTHNMESVEELCDEISLIDNSRVVLQGEVNSIRSRFKESVFSACVDMSNQMEAGEELPYEVIALNPLGELGELRVKKRSEISNSDLIIQLAKRYEIHSFEEILPSMNDIFIRVVKS
ncbi:MAG: ABC transporter ATP-binding protein [Bacteroidales bacterium]